PAGAPGPSRIDRRPSDRGPSMPGVQRREVTGMGDLREVEELLLIEEADAWFEYLEATRNQTAHRYREVEPWAWARLNQRLRTVRTKRAKLRPAAAYIPLRRDQAGLGRARIPCGVLLLIGRSRERRVV